MVAGLWWLKLGCIGRIFERIGLSGKGINERVVYWCCEINSTGGYVGVCWKTVVTELQVVVMCSL